MIFAINENLSLITGLNEYSVTRKKGDKVFIKPASH